MPLENHFQKEIEYPDLKACISPIAATLPLTAVKQYNQVYKHGTQNSVVTTNRKL